LPIADPAEARAWLRLIRTPELGARGLRELRAAHGSAQTAAAAGPSAWRAAGLGEAAIAWLARPDEAQIDADLRWLEQPGHHLLSFDQTDFPPLLTQAPNPPAVLFVVGTIELLWSAQIGIVGSRNASAGGRDNAREFAAALADSGLTITSGLAEGVDAAAHQAAVDAGRPTIAVMGTGPDRIYPARHRELAHAIAASGALVSEYPPGAGARRDHFPRRNRIIAGLSLGVLVVEAAQQSGALITARQAAECGREVFALPGSIHNPLARGCHQLIRDGASLVTCAQDILDALGPAALAQGARLRERLAAETATTVAADEDTDYAKLWAALGHDPLPIEVLAERSGLTVAALSSMLLLLELEGRVAASHGRYARR